MESNSNDITRMDIEGKIQISFSSANFLFKLPFSIDALLKEAGVEDEDFPPIKAFLEWRE